MIYNDLFKITYRVDQISHFNYPSFKLQLPLFIPELMSAKEFSISIRKC